MKKKTSWLAHILKKTSNKKNREVAQFASLVHAFFPVVLIIKNLFF